MIDKVDLLLPTFNRKEFTEVTLENLFENSTPSLVNELLITDGPSKDGTSVYIAERLKKPVPFKTRVIKLKEAHVVNAMIKARNELKMEYVGKVDSDTVVPPGWLEACISTINRNPKCMCLGIEPLFPFNKDVVNDRRNIRKVRHIGGIGLFKRDAWQRVVPSGKHQGWTGEQTRNTNWLIGWIDPPIRTILLDRLPFNPFRRYAEAYAKRGWQRLWGKYPEAAEYRWNWKFPNWREMHAKA